MDVNGFTLVWEFGVEVTGAAHVSCSYGAAGRVVSMVDATSTHTYIPVGRVASHRDGLGQTVSYGYDVDGDGLIRLISAMP